MKKSILLMLVFFSGIVADSGQYGGVKPLDTQIPSFDVLDQVITGPVNQSYVNRRTGGWIEQGNTYLVHPADASAMISDAGVTFWRMNGLSFNNNDLASKGKFSPADLDAIKKLSTKFGNRTVGQLPASDVLKSGHYEPNWDALVAAIQKGNFVNLTYYRLVLSEYLLGRMAAAVSPLIGSAWLSNTYSDSGIPSDQDVIKGFTTVVADNLVKTRYGRNAFTPAYNNQASVQAASSGWGQINNSSSTSGSDYVHYLKPADTFAGLILVNRMSGNSAFTIGGQTSQVQPGTVGLYPISGSADKWESSPADNQLWGNKRVVIFSVEGVSQQGQVQLYEDLNQLPQIFTQGPSGVPVKIDFDDKALQSFFSDPHPWAIVVRSSPEKVLEVIGLAKLNTVSFPNALSFVGRSTSDASNGSFSLGDLWAMPMSLYQKTIASVNEAAGQPYPLASWVLQALFNGYLQTSFFDPVVPASVGKKMWKDAWNYPSDSDWINPANSLDWKFLRALIVTQAANRIMYINNISLASIEQILSAPQTSIQDKFYVGATDSYVPVVRVKS